MAKSIEQMTIAELQKAIRDRKKMAKKTPGLRKEKTKLLARLAEIDAALAQAGPARGRRPGQKKAAASKAARKATRKTTKKPAAKKPAKAPVAKKPAPAAAKGLLVFVPGKRLPRGTVQKAVLAVIGSAAMAPAQIAKAVAKGYVKGIPPRNVAVTVGKMGRTGVLVKLGRGKYKKA